VVTGARVLGRAVTEAWKQAQASANYARAQAKNNPGAANTFASHGLTLEEACKILNVKPPQAGKANLEDVTERFKRLFDVNDPKKGGSFYLQSKREDRIGGTASGGEGGKRRGVKRGMETKGLQGSVALGCVVFWCLV
jgi:hypothetical protein